MFDRWAQFALALGLAASVVLTPSAWGQATRPHTGQGHRRGVLRQNDPNPFDRETAIPFTVGDDACAPGTQRHVVTLRIYNILSQVVAFAALVDSTSTGTGDSTSTTVASWRPITNVPLACGTYLAHWNGTRTPDGRAAPPGVYMYQLLIDGHPAGMRKMLLTR